jgi:hypothetical protein
MKSSRQKRTLVCAALFAGLAALHLSSLMIGVKTATTAAGVNGVGRTDFHIEGARVVAPGVIRVDFQIGREAFNCSGGTDYYIWFFGITKRIRWTRWDS